MILKHLQALGLAAALTFGAAGAASAQTVTTDPALETDRTLITTERDEGFDWGWLGLLGLIGLAGLSGRKKTDNAHQTDTRTADVNRTNVYDTKAR